MTSSCWGCSPSKCLTQSMTEQGEGQANRSCAWEMDSCTEFGVFQDIHSIHSWYKPTCQTFCMNRDCTLEEHSNHFSAMMTLQRKTDSDEKAVFQGHLSTITPFSRNSKGLHSPVCKLLPNRVSRVICLISDCQLRLGKICSAIKFICPKDPVSKSAFKTNSTWKSSKFLWIVNKLSLTRI